MAAVLEVTLRVINRKPGSKPAQTEDVSFLACERDSALGWVFPPSAQGPYRSGRHPTDVHTNELGIRSRPIDSGSQSIRVLVLGDSYAFGWGVPEEDAFPRQLESMIGRRFRSVPVEVINAGLPGYGLYQQHAMLLKVLSVTEIDIVVSTFSLANDPVDDLRIDRYAPDRLTEYSSDVTERSPFLNEVIGRSRLLSMLNRRTSVLRFQLANASNEALRATSRSMNALLQTCAEHGIRTVCVIVPHRSEIVAGSFKARLALAQSARARRLRASLAEQHGVPLIDVTDALSEAQKAEEVYLPNDPHWTPAGHRAVAKAILEILPEKWLVEPSS
ncbi:MAG: hypothetical protein KAW67_07640 [Candidatus Eisenbacteria sp.]|nr:hypothetical protein [Candidatus Eisenbacteria bacterium]